MQNYLKLLTVCSFAITAAVSVAAGQKFVVDANSDAVDRAIQLAKAGDTIYLKAGRYAKSIRIKPGVRLEGEGADKVFISGGKDWPLYAFPEPNSDPGIRSEIIGVTVTDCNNTAIYIGGGRKVDISNCVVQNCAVGICVDDSEECKISNCVIRGCSYNGMIVRNSKVECDGLEANGNGVSGVLVDDKSRYVIKNSVLSRNKWGGLLIEKAETVSIDNLICESNLRDGIQCWDTNELNIKGCISRSNSNHGIALNNVLQGNLCEMEATDNEACGVFLGGRNSCMIKDSTASRNKTYGIKADKTQSVKIDGLVCEFNTYEGIYCEDSNQIEIKRCIARKNKQHGIILQSAINVDICRLEATGNGSSGMWVLGKSSCSIKDSVFKDNKLDGIFSNDEVYKISVDNTICASNNESGMSISSGNTAKIKNNICIFNGGDGISVHKGPKEIELSGNRCKGNMGRGGIALSGLGGRAKVSGNISWQNKQCGIIVEYCDANMVFENNQCIDNRSNGMHFVKSINARIIDNTLRANLYDGAYVGDRSKLEFVQNKFLNNAGSGLRVDESSARVLRNTLNGNGIRGLYLYSTAITMMAKENECVNNGRIGIDVEKDAKALLVANSCRGNMWAGINVADSSAWVNIGNNVCEDNGAWGIVVPQNGRATVDENNKTGGNGKGGQLHL